MKKLKVSIYKYGEYRRSDTYNFGSIRELEEWVSNSVKFTDREIEMEKLCGESLNKWSGTFIYNNRDYYIYIDC